MTRARSGGSALPLVVAGAGGLGMSLVVGKVVAVQGGADLLGAYALVVTLWQALTLALAMGTQTVVLSWAAAYEDAELTLWRKAKGVVTRHTSLAGLAVAALVASGVARGLVVPLVLLLLAAVINALAQVRVSFLSAAGLPRAYATSTLGGAVAGAVAYTALVSGGVRPALLVVGCLVQAVVTLSVATAARSLRGTAGVPEGFYSQSLSLGASSLAGTGVQLLVPVLLTATSDLRTVGAYRAATSLAQGYLVVASLIFGQRYLPALSATRDDEDQRLLVADQHRSALIALVPVLSLVILLAPRLLELLFTREFLVAVPLLVLLAVADVLRVSAWSQTFLLIARERGRAFLVTEVVGGLALVTGVLLGARSGPLGIGVGALAALLLYRAAVLVVCSRLGVASDTKRLVARELPVLAVLGGLALAVGVLP